MNRTLLYPLLLACGLSLSACNAESADGPEFTLEVEYTAIGRPQISVTSLNDQVTIQKVLINGGKSKCRVMLRNDIGGQLGGTHFPLKLNYTERWLLVMTEPCRLREVTLFTNLGNASYTIE
ncbi:hypothetical protein CAK78_17945 [Aeromonas sp. A35_P]|uniref:hypothetical protein n=1 Tax=Aeromonas sp. A35_P TaxID=1983805 RepID=UPI000B9B7C70|nr:hypothetical protein [Aeromonas sp. A35_P]OZG40590.1 hypothetical protein CAK78_17945 [Aeromonas sp. A35_P]